MDNNIAISEVLVSGSDECATTGVYPANETLIINLNLKVAIQKTFIVKATRYLFKDAFLLWKFKTVQLATLMKYFFCTEWPPNKP